FRQSPRSRCRTLSGVAGLHHLSSHSLHCPIIFASMDEDPTTADDAREFVHAPCELISFTSPLFCFDVQHKTLRTKAYVIVNLPAGIFRDDSRFDFDFFAVSRRHYFAWHAIDITNPASQRLDCRCAPESLGIAELRTIAILMLDDLTP